MMPGLEMKNWLIQLQEKVIKTDSVDLSDMPLLESDEEVKEKKGLQFLSPTKIKTRLPILLSQRKSGRNSYKLENEIRQIQYLQYQHNKITKNVCKNLIKPL